MGRLSTLCASALIAVGCCIPASTDPPDPVPVPSAPPAAPETPDDDDREPSEPEGDGELADVEDEGDFRVEYRESEEFSELRASLMERRAVPAAAAYLNARLALPHDIPIIYESCDDENAFYSAENREITLCYELYVFYERALAAVIDDPDELTDAMTGTIIHTLYHEVGHALINIYDLATTGREEDTVDQLATAILIGQGPDGQQAALDAALAFLSLSWESEGETPAYHDEHSMDAQRFHNIQCWVFGSDPDRFEDLIGDNPEEGELPEDRAGICPGEFRQLNDAWAQLLEPFLLPDAELFLPPREQEDEPGEDEGPDDGEGEGDGELEEDDG